MTEASPNQALLELELFKGLKPPFQKSLLAFARIEHFGARTEFIQQNEYTGDFYVVLQGLVSAYRTETDGSTQLLYQLGPGEWFGEVSALSNQPSLAKLKADLPGTLVKLESALFKELYLGGGDFKKRVDARYAERSLEQHLRVVPLFKGIEKRALRRLQRAGVFEVLQPKITIATEGSEIDALYLIRSGAVTESKGGRLVGYQMTNSSIGEQAFAREGASWPATYETMLRTDVLKIPISAVKRALADDAKTLSALQVSAQAIALEEAGEMTGFYNLEEGQQFTPEALAQMVEKGSAKGGEALVIELDKCVRCNACVESCVAVHDDHVPRLSKKGNRISAEGNALKKDISLATSCYHCQTPGCMMSCAYGAIRRDSKGLIRFIYDNCVGCAACSQACPYDVIRLTAPPGSEYYVEPEPSMLERLPLVGRFFSSRPAVKEVVGERGYHKDVKAMGKSVKCDRCEGLPFEACVYNCPTGAIQRMEPAAVFEGIPEAAARIAGAPR